MDAGEVAREGLLLALVAVEPPPPPPPAVEVELDADIADRNVPAPLDEHVRIALHADVALQGPLRVGA